MPKISSRRLTKLYEEKVKLFKRLEEIEKEERDERDKIIRGWNVTKE